MDDKKLFIVVNHDWFFLSHRKEIALAAKRVGYNISIVTKDTGKRKIIEDLGLKFIDLPLDSTGMNIWKEIKTFRFLYTLYRFAKPDIVHQVGLKMMLWGGLAAKLGKVKGVINAITGLGILFAEENFKSLKTRCLLHVLRYSHNRNNLKVIFQNNEDKSLFLDYKIIKAEQSSMIKGSGVDLFDFAYSPEPTHGKIKVVLTARMVEDKGVLDLIDAANLLKAEYCKNVQFILCGGIDSNPKAITEEKLLHFCDGEYICWLGHRSDIKNILINSHIFVLPSYYKEGLPKSLIEAAAIGRPIVTTNSVGCKETVIDGYNGFLITIKKPVELAERLKQLFDNKALRIEFGINSRKIAERDFSIESVVAKHLDIYKQMKGNDLK
jgi:glycosyltransferase involved in cell wall biosynthesis